MGTIILIVLVFLVLGLIALAVTGLGIGIGYVLVWVIGGLDKGMGILVGVVVAVGTIDLFLRLVSAFLWHGSTAEEGDEDVVVMDESFVLPRRLWGARGTGKTKGK